jgi:hypothetical protein
MHYQVVDMQRPKWEVWCVFSLQVSGVSMPVDVRFWSSCTSLAGATSITRSRKARMDSSRDCQLADGQFQTARLLPTM